MGGQGCGRMVEESDSEPKEDRAMLVQLNRNAADRDFTVTATDLPVNPGSLPTAGSPRPVVAVTGHPGRVAGLDRHLPPGWLVRFVADLDDVLPDELVLITAATVRDVVLARRLLPGRTQVVALVDEVAPAEVVAGVLTAGADACVTEARSAPEIAESLLEMRARAC